MSSSAALVGSSASAELQTFLDVFYPLAEKTSPSQRLREKEWPAVDTHGQQVVSLTMVERWVQRKLERQLGQKQGTAVYKQYFPALIRAFDAARAAGASATQPSDEDNADSSCIGPLKFQSLVANLCVFAAALDAFRLFDGGGSQTGADDQRLTRTEWLRGANRIVDHGFVVLQQITQGDETSLERIYDEMSNNSHVVMLTDWCNYLKAKEIAASTVMGKLVGDQDVPTARLSLAGERYIPKTAESPAPPNTRPYDMLAHSATRGKDPPSSTSERILQEVTPDKPEGEIGPDDEAHLNYIRKEANEAQLTNILEWDGPNNDNNNNNTEQPVTPANQDVIIRPQVSKPPTLEQSTQTEPVETKAASTTTTTTAAGNDEDGGPARVDKATLMTPQKQPPPETTLTTTTPPPVVSDEESPNLVELVLAEFIAMILYIWIGCGTLVSSKYNALIAAGDNNNTNNNNTNTEATHLAPALSFGLGLIILTSASTIGMLNPAVTVAKMMSQQISPTLGGSLILVQCLGALLGAALLLGSAANITDYDDDDDEPFRMGANVVPEDLPVGNAFVAETMGTLLITWVALTHPLPWMYGLAVGAAHLVLLPLTSCGINPARTIGPALVLLFRGEKVAHEGSWVFYIAPLFGALLAGLMNIALPNKKDKVKLD